jgi:hypothetical protein
MAPPTQEEIRRGEQLVREYLRILDPQGRTPEVLRELLIEYGARHTPLGGALRQATLDPPPQQVQQHQQVAAPVPQAQQGQGQGRGRGRGAPPQSPGGSGRGSVRGRGS